jgi:hypothetical protein
VRAQTAGLSRLALVIAREIELFAARRGRLMGLDAEDIEAAAVHIAQLVASTPAKLGLVDAQDLAEQLGVARDWIYANAERLGVVRLGTGPCARLRFDVERARETSAGAGEHDQSRRDGRGAGVDGLVVRLCPRACPSFKEGPTGECGPWHRAILHLRWPRGSCPMAPRLDSGGWIRCKLPATAGGGVNGTSATRLAQASLDEAGRQLWRRVHLSRRGVLPAFRRRAGGLGRGARGGGGAAVPYGEGQSRGVDASESRTGARARDGGVADLPGGGLAMAASSQGQSWRSRWTLQDDP